MKVKKPLVVIMTVACVIGGWWWLFRKDNTVEKTNSVGSNKVVVPIDQANAVSNSGWLTYKNENKKISVDIPNGWSASEAEDKGKFDLWVNFTPDENVSSVSQIALTVIKDGILKDGFDSETDFGKYRNTADYTKLDGEVIKLINNNLDGFEAVTFSNKGKDDNGEYWVYLSWWRKDNINYYLNSFGYGEQDDLHLQLHLNVVGRVVMLGN